MVASDSRKINISSIYLSKFLIQIGSPCQCRGIGFNMVHMQVLVNKLSGLDKFDHLRLWKEELKETFNKSHIHSSAKNNIITHNTTYLNGNI